MPTTIRRPQRDLVIQHRIRVFLAGFCLLLVADMRECAAQTYRFVFLGPKSPVLMEVQIQAGPFGLDQVRQRYAQGAFERLDQDHNGMLDSSEAAAIPLGGRFIATAKKIGTDWKEHDTEPTDDLLSLEELRRCLDVQLGPPLTVERQVPRLTQTVRLYEELDTNGDQSISPEEFDEGLRRLQRSDFDDDEALSVAELQPFPLSVVQAQQMADARDPDQELPLVLATTTTERERAAERILTTYGAAQPLTNAEQLGISERFFRAFDMDKEGSLNAAELVRYLEKSPAQLNLSVSLAPPQVALGRIGSGETVTVISSGGRPVLDLAGVPVEYVARNKARDLRDQVSLFKIRLRTSDADKNGYLDRGEFAGLQAPAQFEDVDLDGNEQVVADEIDLYFTLDGLAAQSRLVATLSNEAKVLFNLLDANSDNRLTERELRDATNVLTEYDRNGDGALGSSELASRFRITISQPELIDVRVDTAMNTAARQGIVREEASGPLWFRRMDRNLDGDVSWREFPGSQADFAAIDQDADGLITLPEAERAEAMRGRAAADNTAMDDSPETRDSPQSAPSQQDQP
ncbi:MAG: hypothetical protein KDA58_00085 [Planctomycetaceae bacterium]|nr:hypothetical protein [Planctomycetaceae bacterium]